MASSWSLIKRSRTLIHHKKKLAFLGIGSAPTFSSSSSSPFMKRPCAASAPYINNHFRFLRRFESTKAEAAQLELQHYVTDDDDNNQKRVPCYRVLDDNGMPMKYSNYVQISKEMAVKMYSDMVTLQTMDSIFYEVQRQGRISFYLTSMGEEAVNIASAAALSFDDVILPQYREPGVLLWRGFTLQQFVDQLFGNTSDLGKGRQMPIHYGSNKHNYFTVSSPIA
ncbi:hypothetical protein Ahy_A07g036057 isoform B [Arachis hypogaea]|nr:hypothetical protein Ahy_A07g036057 isoform B [Arachis hypogaea]